MVIKPKTKPRKNWEQAFKQMHKNGDDQLLIDGVFNGEFIEE